MKALPLFSSMPSDTYPSSPSLPSPDRLYLSDREVLHILRTLSHMRFISDEEAFLTVRKTALTIQGEVLFDKKAVEAFRKDPGALQSGFSDEALGLDPALFHDSCGLTESLASLVFTAGFSLSSASLSESQKAFLNKNGIGIDSSPGTLCLGRNALERARLANILVKSTADDEALLSQEGLRLLRALFDTDTAGVLDALNRALAFFKTPVSQDALLEILLALQGEEARRIPISDEKNAQGLLASYRVAMPGGERRIYFLESFENAADLIDIRPGDRPALLIACGG